MHSNSRVDQISKQINFLREWLNKIRHNHDNISNIEIPPEIEKIKNHLDPLQVKRR